MVFEDYQAFSILLQFLRYVIFFSTSPSFLANLILLFILAWSYLDERHCRDYDKYPELTRTIISRLDFIEDQRGELDDLSGTDYPVSYFL